jgi:ABC-type multidrug transport system fused ATPase/permease subunit
MPKGLNSYIPLKKVVDNIHTESDLDAAPFEIIPDGTDGDVLSIRVPAPIECDRGIGVRFSGLDIIEFSSPLYFVDNASEPYLMLDVIRIGSMRGTASVKLCTEDVSARAGDRYEALSTEVVFGDGVSSQAVRVNLTPKHVWAATLEFKLVLSQPMGNCELGLYLHTARVKLMDSTPFPSTKYHDMLMDPNRGSKAVPPWGLLWEYIKLNFHTEGLSWRTVVTLIFDQLDNVLFIGTLFLNIYLVDVVLNIKDADTESRLLVPSRARTAMIVGAIFAIPQLLIHIWEYARLKLATAGMSRAFLQTSLFRKYMNYSEESRRNTTTIENEIMSNSSDVVDSYMMALDSVKQFGRLVIMLCFLLRHNSQVWWAICLLPVLMFLFIVVDPEDANDASEGVLDKKKKVSALVNEVQQKYEIIQDFFQRPQMNTMFANEIGGLNQAIFKEAVVLLNYMMVPPHIGSIFTAAWIAWKSQDVLRGEQSLGEFLAMVSICKEMASRFGAFYKLLLDFKRNLVTLRSLAHHFNLETDMPHMKNINRQRRELAKSLREKKLKHAEGFEFTRPIIDTLPLEMRSVTFSYVKGEVQLVNASASAHQSSLVAIDAANGRGESTVLRVIALKLFPQSGVVGIPAHLRILHVSQDPVVLSMPAWENLTFSCPDADPERVLKILEWLRAPYIQSLVEADLRERKPHEYQDRRCGIFFHATDEGAQWIKRLSRSEQAKVHLARAFIMNPEVMVCQHPFKHLDGNGEHDILFDMMRSHIDSRGIVMPAQTTGRRRPRTVFFTSDEDEYVQQADVIWFVDSERGLQMKPPMPQPSPEVMSREYSRITTHSTHSFH